MKRILFYLLTAFLFAGCNYKIVHYSRVYYMERGFLLMGKDPNQHYFFKSDVYFEDESCIKELFESKAMNDLKVFYAPLPIDFQYYKYFHCFFNNDYSDTIHITPVIIAYGIVNKNLKPHRIINAKIDSINYSVSFRVRESIGFAWINPLR